VRDECVHITLKIRHHQVESTQASVLKACVHPSTALLHVFRRLSTREQCLSKSSMLAMNEVLISHACIGVFCAHDLVKFTKHRVEYVLTSRVYESVCLDVWDMSV
jgi:hypothetical protein